MGFWALIWLITAIAIMIFTENKSMGYAALIIANVYIVGSRLERGKE